MKKFKKVLTITVALSLFGTMNFAELGSNYASANTKSNSLYSGNNKAEFSNFLENRKNNAPKKRLRNPNRQESIKKASESQQMIKKIHLGEVEKPKNSAKPVNTYNRGFKLKVHGNWCGPGHGAVEGYYADTPAVDILDQGCKYHDICYLENGPFNIKCDREFVKYIDENKSKMTPWQKFLAGIIRIIFNR